MLVRDTAAVASQEVTPEGFLRLHARIGRSGLHDYTVAELGHPPGFAPDGRVRVYRPAAEVFDPASMASFAGKPVTDDHPPAMVDANNWRLYAIGHAGESVTREGDHLAADLLVADKAAAERARAGAEISNGYHADFVFEPGTTPEGEAYDAVQRNIRGNHIALVDAGRCGPACHTRPDVDVGDCACSGDAPAEPMAADGATLDALVAERLIVVDAARRLLGPSFDPAGRATAGIRRLVAERRLGIERIAGRDDAYVAAAFDTLLALQPVPTTNPLAVHLSVGLHDGLGGRDAALAARDRFLTHAWKHEPTNGVF